MSDDLTKEQREELEKLQKEIIDEAKKVVEDYVDNPSDISGSVVNIHQNSPVLDTDEISSDLSSSDKIDNWSKDRIFKSLGDEIFSKIDF